MADGVVRGSGVVGHDLARNRVSRLVKGEKRLMSCGNELSIFSFKENTRVTRAGSQSGVLTPVLDSNGQNLKPGMLLDLENLTPETLDLFFPSEKVSAK
jgi:hypothetical protein